MSLPSTHVVMVEAVKDAARDLKDLQIEASFRPEKFQDDFLMNLDLLKMFFLKYFPNRKVTTWGIHRGYLLYFLGVPQANRSEAYKVLTNENGDVPWSCWTPEIFACQFSKRGLEDDF